MPKADLEALMREALARAMADPAPRPLLGTKAKPGIFVGSTQPVKNAAQRAVEQEWIEATDQFEGQGRSKKPLYRITPAGIAQALQHSEAAEVLREMLGALDGQSKRLERLQADVEAASQLAKAQTQAAKELLNRVAPPNVAEIVKSAASHRPAEPPSRPVDDNGAHSGWSVAALKYLAEHRRKNPYGRCPLPELFQQTAAPRRLSIGEFHDGLRQLAAEGRIGLHPFTSAAYQLRDEQYALVAGQEIKYYAELVEA
jgi:hypothetical protein